MKKYILLLFISILAMSSKAQPPNNAIFFGGAGEGSSGLNFAITGASIFIGSAGDGAGHGSNNAVSNTLFFGGTGDGFAHQSNNPLSNTLFLGGAGDGFAHQSNNSISNNIFRGSIGDGMVHSTNNAVSNNIFRGGDGDGWNAVIFPMGPLPVKLLSFTAEYAGKTHLVKWVTTEEINTNHFEVQRSANGRDFTSIGNATPMGGPSAGATYRHTVPDPWAGNNFYRLKIIDKDGSVDYSEVVLLKNDGDLQLSVYPNPTATLLYVKIPLINGTNNINAMLYDAAGKMLMQPVLKAGTSNGIDVSRLAAGLYTLQCTINNQPFVLRFMVNK